MSKKSELHSSIDSIRELLTRVGLRTTPARTAVIRWLQEAKKPATHAEIANDLVSLGIDKATVFRNLNDLADSGVVSRTELGDRVWRFEIRDLDHVDQEQHPHFVCVDCGKVTCLHKVELPKATSRILDQVGDVTEILIRGHCALCR